MAEPTFAPGSQASLRSSNDGRVVDALRTHGGLTQADIARLTGLSKASVSNIVRRLRAAGVLDVASDQGSRRRIVTIGRRGGLAVAVDLGHQHVGVAIGDLSNRILADAHQPFAVDDDGPGAIGIALDMIRRTLASLGRPSDEIVGGAIGLPAPIDMRSGVVAHPAIMPGWTGLHPGEIIGAAIGCTVLVDNDANLAALAEFTEGAGQGHRHGLFVKVSSGIGAGLIVDGRIYRGVAGMAGELGHISIDDHGPLCRCGNRGCLQTFAGAKVLIGQVAESHGIDLGLGDLIDGALAGDPAYQRVIHDAGLAIGSAIAIAANLFNPGLVVIGGELIRAGELLLDPVRSAVQRHAIPRVASDLVVTGASLGPRAALKGALALALSEAVRPRVGSIHEQRVRISA